MNAAKVAAFITCVIYNILYNKHLCLPVQMTVFTEKPTFYVVGRKNNLLEKHGETLKIRDSETKEVIKSAPALMVRDVVICGDVDLSADVFSLLEKHSIPLHFLSTGGKFRGGTVFDFSKNVFLRHKQYQLHHDQTTKLSLARTFVNAKVSNQNRVLQKIRAKGRLELDTMIFKTLDELRGGEGAMARKYFSIWKEEELVKGSGFQFPGRIKRPSTDPVNSLLSFCFTLLHSEIHTQLLIAGLDPYTGFLHDQTYGHAALASDMVEPFRGPAEHFVLRCINRREFDATEDFEEETGGAVKLSRSGFQKFFPKWAEFLRKDPLWGEKSITRTIERDVRHLTHYLMGDVPEFQPFIWE